MKVVIRPTSSKGLVLLGESKSTPVLTVNGKQIEGRYLNAEKQPNGTTLYQYQFPGVAGGEIQNGTISYAGETSPALNFAGGQAEFRTENGGISGVDQAPNKAAFGGAGGGLGGLGPNQVGQFGFAPANLTSQFPSPFLTNYQPIQAAPYKFTDVKKFAQQFGKFNRGELDKNYQQSKGFALDTLDTELQSLKGYVPAASALKRQETSIDNTFNQGERTNQLDSALPGVRGQLASQGQRAETYANGGLPDPVQNQAYESGIRSAAADVANAGGFGARSSVARKASDLMSAKERLGLSQYGDQLLTGNINQRANIELAPTEYSNAGSQINVNPPASFSQLSQSNFGQVNQSTLLAPATALNGQISQNQFVTGNEQNTRQFNAGNTLQNDQSNAATQNSFALNKFGYQVGLAGANAGAAQTNLNTGIAVDQQNQAQANYVAAQKQTQSANQTGDILQTIGALLPIAATIFGGAPPGYASAISATAIGANNGTLKPSDVVSGSLTGQTGLDSIGGGSTVSSLGSVFGLSAVSPSINDTTTSIEGGGIPLRSAAVLNSAGVSSSPQAGYTSAGVDENGNDVYSSQALANDNTTDAGANLVNQTQKALQPLQALDGNDSAKFTRLAATVSSPDTIAALDNAVDKKSKNDFVSRALNVVQDKSPETTATASKLYSTWPQMSTAQKSLGLAALGVLSYKTSDGTPLAAKNVKDGLTVGKSLQLLNSGYNAYSLSNNWDQLKYIQSAGGIPGGTDQLASTAKTLGLLGEGPHGAVVANVDQAFMDKLKATPASQYGVGALAVPKGTTVPAGYTRVATSPSGQSVILPKGNANTTPPGVDSLVGKASNGNSGVNKIYNTWEKAGKSAQGKGSLGGSAMVAGLQYMKTNNPVLLRSTIAKSINAKPTDTLSYTAKLGGSTLAKLITGAASESSTQKGNTFSKNALKGNNNEGGVIKNLRIQYANEGIRSKADGYRLANQAYSEGRINDIDLVAAQQALDSIF